MRVIGGEFRSRFLKSVSGQAVRPTPDRLRESLFNILAPEIEGVAFLDAYAGTGSVGIEALSRGARTAIFIERSSEALAVLRENLQSLKIEERAKVIRGNAIKLSATVEADIVFLDPPYPQKKDYEAMLQSLETSKARLVIAQHEVQQTLAETCGPWQKTRVVRQGSNCLSFYQKGEGGDNNSPPRRHEAATAPTP